MELDGQTGAGYGARLGFGWLIRSLRERRGLSQEGLAKRAKVSLATIRRWEASARDAETIHPRVPELKAVLATVHASPEELATILRVALDVPRGAQALGEVVTCAPALGLPPSPGELLRAMRERRGLTGSAVASKLRVSASTVNRWELHRRRVPEGLLPDLLDLLGAWPEERAAILSRTILVNDERPAPSTPDEWEGHIDALLGRVYMEPDRLPGDLMFRTEAARLWSKAAAGESGYRLAMARLWCAHAEWLCQRGRFVEAAGLGDRTLGLLRTELKPSTRPTLWMEAALYANGHALKKEHPHSSFRRYESEVVPMMLDHLDPSARSHLLRETADAARRAGFLRIAMAQARSAIEAAEEGGKGEYVSGARLIFGRVLRDAGEAAKALDYIPTPASAGEGEGLVARISTLLEWAETQCLTGESEEAAKSLASATALVQEHAMGHLWTEVKRIERLLD